MKQTSGAKQQGFVLAVVLWSVAALTLITGSIIAMVNNTLQQAYSMRDLARLEQDMMATEQTLLYLLSVRPHNEAGSDLAWDGFDPDTERDPFAARNPNLIEGPVLRFDSTLYRGIGRAGFSIQDAGATLSLLEPRREPWLRTMELLGIERGPADQWYDQLMDYQDLDQFSRLNGAEKDSYRQLGLPPPPDRFLVTPHELRNLPLAREYPDVTEALIMASTTGTGNMANLNTSPALSLQLVHWLGEADAARLVEQRGEGITRSLGDASTRFGMLFQDGFETLWQPSGNVRIMLGDVQGRHKRWLEVRFTATVDGAPWTIEYHHPVNLAQTIQELDTADVFSPDVSIQAANHPSAWPSYPAFFPAQLPLE